MYLYYTRGESPVSRQSFLRFFREPPLARNVRQEETLPARLLKNQFIMYFRRYAIYTLLSYGRNGEQSMDGCFPEN